MAKCLICYQDTGSEAEYHLNCSKQLFNGPEPLQLEYDLGQMKELARKTVASHANVTGAQPKISLALLTSKAGPSRLTLDVKGEYILKPPSEAFPMMGESEAVTMQMAKVAGIAVVPHGLIRLHSGELAYITRRTDRHKGAKIHQEDLCQLSERLSEHKYLSSVEKVGKVIAKYCTYPGLAKVDFYTLVLYSFITGNKDMHMKNYSLTHKKDAIMLSRVYDLLNVRLVNPKDKEESALTINGKKSNLNARDFKMMADNLGLTDKQVEGVNKTVLSKANQYKIIISRSFLSNEAKAEYMKFLELNINLFK